MPNNSMQLNDSLFDIAELIADGTDSLELFTDSSDTNIHSHYNESGSSNWSEYEYTGWMMLSSSEGGIGVTFYSNYNSSDHYYRLRRYNGAPTFHLAPHGTNLSGDTDTGVNPQPGVRYQFRIQISHNSSTTNVKAKVWEIGTLEPGWQANASDSSSTRRAKGTVGAWSMGAGDEFWGSLAVSFDGSTTPPNTTEYCGDGIVQSHLNEECDDENSSNTDSCLNSCHLPYCGDGFVQSNEQCDDGNENNSDSCNNQCQLSSTGPYCPAGGRGPVQIVNNNVVADNGWPLRGEHIAITNWNGPVLNSKAQFFQHLDKFVAKGLNTIRAVIYRQPVSSCAYSGTCLPTSQIISKLDAIIPWAAERCFYVIIDHHSVGSMNSGHHSSALQFWQEVAYRYRNHKNVLYELANEPVGWTASNYNNMHKNFQKDGFNLIRGLAPNRHIILWSFAHNTYDMCDKVSEVPQINYGNASVGFHAYSQLHVGGALRLRDGDGSSSCQNGYPIFMTEKQDTEGYGYDNGNFGASVSDFENFPGGSLAWVLLKSIEYFPGAPDYPFPVSWTPDPRVN